MKFFQSIKVLMQNRPKGQWIGGDQIQLEKTIDAIAHKVHVEFNDQPVFTPALLLQMFDIVHLWNFSMEWTKYQIWAASRHKRKIVISMIYHDTEAYIPYEHQQIMVDTADALIFLSEGEIARARNHLVIPNDKIHIIENGIDEFWLTTKKQDWEKSGYVLTVGRIDGTKGQLETSIACKNLGLEYVCVGEVMDEKYAKSCKKFGAHIVGALPQREILPIYDNARLFVLASTNEIFPLTVMEAGARGLNSVVTDTCEWKEIPQVEWCKWGDSKSIEEAIKKSLEKEENKAFKKKLKGMTWDKVGEQVLKVYQKIYE